MPLLWLRVALVLYGVGLVYALLALARRGQAQILARATLPLVATGAVFHLVALAERAAAAGHLAPGTLDDAESLLAFIVIAFFLVAWARYRTLSPGIFVFPVVFLLTFAAALGQQPPEFSSPLLRSGWIALHIVLIFSGYAALVFSFAASLLYLAQERGLKAKTAGALLARLPALEVIDEIGTRALLLGFPFMTLGLVVGAMVAEAEFGAGFLRDPKIVLSLLMWVVYMVLLYTRWNAGWRGRRAAFLSTAVFL